MPARTHARHENPFGVIRPCFAPKSIPSFFLSTVRRTWHGIVIGPKSTPKCTMVLSFFLNYHHTCHENKCVNAIPTVGEPGCHTRFTVNNVPCAGVTLTCQIRCSLLYRRSPFIPIGDTGWGKIECTRRKCDPQTFPRTTTYFRSSRPAQTLLTQRGILHGPIRACLSSGTVSSPDNVSELYGWCSWLDAKVERILVFATTQDQCHAIVRIFGTTRTTIGGKYDGGFVCTRKLPPAPAS